MLLRGARYVRILPGVFCICVSGQFLKPIRQIGETSLGMPAEDVRQRVPSAGPPGRQKLLRAVAVLVSPARADRAARRVARALVAPVPDLVGAHRLRSSRR